MFPRHDEPENTRKLPNEYESAGNIADEDVPTTPFNPADKLVLENFAKKTLGSVVD